MSKLAKIIAVPFLFGIKIRIRAKCAPEDCTQELGKVIEKDISVLFNNEIFKLQSKNVERIFNTDVYLLLDFECSFNPIELKSISTVINRNFEQISSDFPPVEIEQVIVPQTQKIN